MVCFFLPLTLWLADHREMAQLTCVSAKGDQNRPLFLPNLDLFHSPPPPFIHPDPIPSLHNAVTLTGSDVLNAMTEELQMRLWGWKNEEPNGRQQKIQDKGRMRMRERKGRTLLEGRQMKPGLTYLCVISRSMKVSQWNCCWTCVLRLHYSWQCIRNILHRGRFYRGKIS